jgi:hypothetical protein
MLTRKRVVVAKVETAEGTFETLAAADGGIEVYEAKFETPPKFFDRQPLRGTLSQKTGIPGPQAARLTFRCELKGSAAAGTAPTWGKYLKACGFGETIVPSTSVTYAPASASIPSLSMALHDDGVIHQLKGARGNVKLAGRVGEPMFLDFAFEGVYHATADGATPSVTYADGAIVPLALMGANILTLHTYNPVLTAVELDLGNTLALRESVNSAAGILSALITGRNPRGTLDPEMTTVAAHDWYGKFRSGATGALALNLTGSAGNRVAISAPAVQYRELSDAERNGNSARSLGILFAMNTGDDELSIALT